MVFMTWSVEIRRFPVPPSHRLRCRRSLWVVTVYSFLLGFGMRSLSVPCSEYGLSTCRAGSEVTLSTMSRCQQSKHCRLYIVLRPAECRLHRPIFKPHLCSQRHETLSYRCPTDSPLTETILTTGSDSQPIAFSVVYESTFQRLWLAV